MLSFLLAHHVAGRDFFGARKVVVSSASSKAAIGTVSLLAELGGPPVVGLTSDARVPFVEGLDLYDEGRDGYDARFEEAWSPFLEASTAWLSVASDRGVDAVRETWLGLVEGTLDASVGHIGSIGR